MHEVDCHGCIGLDICLLVRVNKSILRQWLARNPFIAKLPYAMLLLGRLKVTLTVLLGWKAMLEYKNQGESLFSGTSCQPM